MTNLSAISSLQAEQNLATIRRFISLAAHGLVPMFDTEKNLFCYKLRQTREGLVREGHSHRYTMMTLMGLHRLQQSGGVSPIEIEPALENLLAALDWVDNLGDLGILLWMCGIVCPERYQEVQERLDIASALESYSGAKRRVTMEVAWFLTGLSYWGLTRPEKLNELQALTYRTYELLKRNQDQGGFFGHLATRGSLPGMVRGRIGSFADQVYPIYAMAQFFKAYGHEEAAGRALDCAMGICQAQGDLGQWWWHYDSAAGRVLEGYPVFSVHQHAMAPMTLFGLGEAINYDFQPWIYRGLEWINSQNELRCNMEDVSKNLIWRCVYRDRSSLADYWQVALNRHSDPVQEESPRALKVLRECRPYELGWLLYAFATRVPKQTLSEPAVDARVNDEPNLVLGKN
jgi:hypothetical protein